MHIYGVSMVCTIFFFDILCFRFCLLFGFSSLFLISFVSPFLCYSISRCAFGERQEAFVVV